MNFCYSNGTAN